MSLIAFGSIHEDHEWFSDDYRGRQEIFMCLAALLGVANGIRKIQGLGNFCSNIEISKAF